jgi:hypothetical protein
MEININLFLVEMVVDSLNFSDSHDKQSIKCEKVLQINVQFD